MSEIFFSSVHIFPLPSTQPAFSFPSSSSYNQKASVNAYLGVLFPLIRLLLFLHLLCFPYSSFSSLLSPSSSCLLFHFSPSFSCLFFLFFSLPPPVSSFFISPSSSCLFSLLSHSSSYLFFSLFSFLFLFLLSLFHVFFLFVLHSLSLSMQGPKSACSAALTHLSIPRGPLSFCR